MKKKTISFRESLQFLNIDHLRLEKKLKRLEKSNNRCNVNYQYDLIL